MDRRAWLYVRQWLILIALMAAVWLPVAMFRSEARPFDRFFWPIFIGCVLVLATIKAVKDLLAMKLNRQLRRQIVSLWMILIGGASAISSFYWWPHQPPVSTVNAAGCAMLLFWGVVLLSWGLARFRDPKEAIADVIA